MHSTLRKSSVYRGKSKDASGHEHAADSGQFTSSGSGGSAKPSKPESKLPSKAGSKVKEAAQVARETHGVASAAKAEFEKAKEAYRQALKAHKEARAKYEEADQERYEEREKEQEKKRQAKKEKEKIVSAKVAKLRQTITPESRVMVADAIDTHKGKATPEEKKRGGDDRFAKQSDIVAELEKKGLTNPEAVKLLSDMMKAEELVFMQTGQGAGKPFINWFRVDSSASKPANNLPSEKSVAYRQKSKDASGHEHDEATGQFSAHHGAARAMVEAHPGPKGPAPYVPPGGGRPDLIAKDPALAAAVKANEEHYDSVRRRQTAQLTHDLLTSPRPKPVALPEEGATPGKRISRFKRSIERVSEAYGDETTFDSGFARHLAAVADSHPEGGKAIEAAKGEAEIRLKEAISQAELHLQGLPPEQQEKGRRHLQDAMGIEVERLSKPANNLPK